MTTSIGPGVWEGTTEVGVPTEVVVVAGLAGGVGIRSNGSVAGGVGIRSNGSRSGGRGRDFGKERRY